MHDISFVRKFYEAHLKQYGKEDIRGMGWHNEEEYSVRFEIVCKLADLNNSSILDVGCGFGGLYKHLISSEISNFSYLGIDILPEMVEIAKEKNPTGKFIAGDILKEELKKFDYIFCIGAMNIRTEGFDRYFKKMIHRMIELANKGVIVNFLSGKKYVARGPYHFEDPYRLKEIIEKEHNVSVEVIDDPRLIGESTIFIKIK